MAESGEKIIELRRDSLTATLRLLGFSSIEDAINGINGQYTADNGYKALGKIGHDLENYVHIANIISLDSEENGNGIDINLPDDLDLANLAELLKKIAERTSKDVAYMEDKDEILGRTRSVVDNFELGMDKKVSPEEWEIYSNQVKKVTRFLLSANYDLLPPEQRQGIEDFSLLSKEDIEDKISDVIDTVDFSKAVDIEDRFSIDESAKFVRIIDEMIDGDEEIKRTSPAVALLALQKASLDTRDKKIKFMSKYQAILEKYVKSSEEIKKIVGDGVDQTDDAFWKYRKKGGEADGR